MSTDTGDTVQITCLHSGVPHTINLSTDSSHTHSQLIDLYKGVATLPDAQWWLLTHGGTELTTLEVAEQRVQTERLRLSQYEHWIPLFDIYSGEIYLIYRDNIYRRVYYDHYRFPYTGLLDHLKHSHDATANPSAIDRIQRFMTYYDVHELEKTYHRVIYRYNSEVGKELIICKRPSFSSCFRHVTPWYTRKEVINLALNMGLIKPDTTFYDQKRLHELCKRVRENDISADILLAHRKHVLDSDAIHIVQYYTLNGAYFMNRYLRNLTTSVHDPILERCIMNLWTLIHSTPKMDKVYTLYRFVDNDYLQHLNEGDIYVDPGFISTTRDPFYRAQHYKFGFILIKIHVPQMTGACMSLEPWSNFSKEQEMVIPPFTQLRLLKRNRKAPYFHIDATFEQQVTTRYEFEIVGLRDPAIPSTTVPAAIPSPIDLMKRAGSGAGTVKQRIDAFHKTYLDKRGQFRCTIDGTMFVIMTEWYNSTIAYKEFYAFMNKRGFSMYGFHETDPKQILFVVEVVAELHELHVNWYFRWSDDSNIFALISEESFLLFLSKLAYQFGIQRVVIYGRYRFCHTISGECSGGSYRADVYDYLKDTKKRFSDALDVEEKFSYVQLDSWHALSVDRILEPADKDQFYQEAKVRGIATVAALYLDTVQRHCSQIGVLETKIQRLYQGVNLGFNPLDHMYWVVEPYQLLNRLGYLASIPDDDPEMLPIIKSIPVAEQPDAETDRMNRYRL